MGGGELVCFLMAKSLLENGYSVSILTAKEPDKTEAFKRFGIDISEFDIIVKRPFLDKFLEISGKFVGYRWASILNTLFKEARNGGYDIIIDTQTNMLTKSDIVYIHYVSSIKLRRGLLTTLYNSLVMRKLEKILGNPRMILTNSSWTARQVREHFGRDSLIVYPPVNVNYYMKAWSNTNRDRVVVTISRLDPIKRLDSIVDIASMVKDYTFIILGASFRSHDGVVAKIKEKMDRLRVKNVKLVIDAPRDERLAIMARARYYVHPPFPEPFGIAVVEAMAAGLVPIVYRNSGTWIDVVSKISSLLGYNRIDEVPRIIRTLDNNDELYRAIRSKIQLIIRDFSYESFGKKILNVIKTLE